MCKADADKLRRERRRAAELCIMCGKESVEEGYTRGPKCLAKDVAAKRKKATKEKEPAFTEQEALTEAKWMVQAMRNGEDITDTLAISETTLESLEQFCVEHPEDAYIVKRALEFRKKINEHVKQLLEEGWGHATYTPEGQAADTPSVIAEAARWSASGEDEDIAEEGETQAADYGF